MTNNKGGFRMKAYEIIGAMEDTLDIFLESEGTESDKENYDYYFWQFLKNNKTNILFSELDKLGKENLN